MSISRATSSKPLPEKVGAVVQEARWLLVGLLGIYLGIILLGFDIADPGWSHAATVTEVMNPGGRLGAWVSDLLLYLLGFSAWWLVVLPFFLLAKNQLLLVTPRSNPAARHGIGRMTANENAFLHCGGQLVACVLPSISETKNLKVTKPHS